MTMTRATTRVDRVLALAVGTTILSVLAGAVPGSVAVAEERRSGTVLAFDRLDPARSALVLRVGPWRLKDEEVAAGSEPLRIVLKPATDIVVVSRARSADSSGRTGPLSRIPATVEAVKPGSYVTVTFTAAERDLVADRVEVIAEPLTLYPAPPAAPSGLAVRP